MVHEVLCADNACTSETISGIKNVVRTDGARSKDPKKYQKDARLLEEALKDNPNHTRNRFYLAQSYKDAGDNLLALINYEKRVALGGWDQEVFWSKFQIALLRESLEMKPDTIISSYKDAYFFRPTRAEPLYYLASYLRRQGDYKQAYSAALLGLSLSFPNDNLFVERWIYDYGLLFELSISAYYLEKSEEAFLASQLLLKNPNLPAHFKSAIERNLYWIGLKMTDEVKNISLKD